MCFHCRWIRCTWRPSYTPRNLVLRRGVHRRAVHDAVLFRLFSNTGQGLGQFTPGFKSDDDGHRKFVLVSRSRPEGSAAQVGMLLRRIGEARGANLTPQKGRSFKERILSGNSRVFYGVFELLRNFNSVVKKRQFIQLSILR